MDKKEEQILLVSIMTIPQYLNYYFELVKISWEVIMDAESRLLDYLIY